MRFLAILLSFLALTALAAATSDTALKTQAGQAANSFQELSVLTPDPSERELSLRWVAWQTGQAPDHAVELALFQRQGRQMLRRWSQHWPDGYLPRLQRIWSWRLDQRPLLALTFHYGAAWEHLELFALDTQGKVIPIGAADGSMFDLRFGETGWFFHASQAIDQPPRCLQYRADPPLLAEITCEPSR